MSTIVNNKITSLTMLTTSKKIWFLSFLLAQLGFFAYLIFAYFASAVQEGISEWNKFNDTAFVSDDNIGNALYAIHVLLAIVMIVGSSLQFFPVFRQRFAPFHKYNGRMFVTLACIIASAGIYLIIVRGTVGDTLLHSMTIFSGVIVLISSVMTVYFARKRQFSHHQIWAIRLYLAANAVLFFRLIMFAFFMMFGTVGIDLSTFTGPTIIGIGVSAYIAPLLIAELVRLAEHSKHATLHIFTAILLLTIAVIFVVGLIGISMGNWYPSIR